MSSMFPPESQSVAIVDLGSGNLRSVEKAVERAAADNNLAARVQLTTSADEIRNADRIVLPGVGAFAACMAELNALDGMRDALEEAVFSRGVPLLGICVGMQMMATHGLEFGETGGLGWIPGEVRKLDSSTPGVRVPHMGWNQIAQVRDHALFTLPNLDGADFYFLHSYHFDTEIDVDVTAVCRYGDDADSRVTAAIARDNIAGVQFHPEKSQQAGLAFLAGFLKWIP